jgi:rhodanese-related sulfurtransferase
MPTFRKQPMDIVIDVRSKLEFWLGHLSGAVCIPVGSIADGIAARSTLTKQSRILLVCASGARSAQAAATLRSLGYRRVTDGGAYTSARADYAA